MRKRLPVLLLSISCLLPWSAQALQTPAATFQPSTPVRISPGLVQGYHAEGRINFRGIPYAEAPTGQRRWQPPVDKRAWDGVYLANKFGNSCATTVSLAGFGKPSHSEDCLFLNVYVPEGAAPAPRPVLVVLPGGGLETGSGDEYDPGYFTDKGVVVVTLNFRLGLFGYFHEPALGTPEQAAINFGLLDQQAALRWVAGNIAAFGGDPGRVTLYGESAGGMSVLAHVFSPLSKGLFHGGIASSGAFHNDSYSLAEARDTATRLATLLDCQGSPQAISQCLRNRPAEDFLAPQVSALFHNSFFVDGVSLPHTFADALEAGQFNPVPLISGYNHDEGTFFAAVSELGKGAPLQRADYEGAMRGLYGKRAQQDIFDKPPLPDDTHFTQALATDLGRYKFICPVIDFNARLAAKLPVYSYEFADRQAPVYSPPVSIDYGAYHTGDMAYLFKGFHGASGKVPQFTAQQQRLSSIMVGHASQFIHSGDPNGPGLPAWQRLRPGGHNTLVLANGQARMQDNVRDAFNCPVLQ